MHCIRTNTITVPVHRHHLVQCNSGWLKYNSQYRCKLSVSNWNW